MYFYNYEEISENNPLPLSGYELPYEPEKWNNEFSKTDGSTYVYEETNCYTYALNAPYYLDYKGDVELWEVNPGETNSTEFDYKEYSFVWNYLYNDSIKYNFTIIPINKYEICPIGMYKIAFLCDNETPSEFHFYRQNSDGTWSHKSGGEIVENVDHSNNVIIDPDDANSDRYDEIISYFAVTPLNTFDLEKVGERLTEALNKNYYNTYREWPYKSVKPRIIAEKFMEDESVDDVYEEACSKYRNHDCDDRESHEVASCLEETVSSTVFACKCVNH